MDANYAGVQALLNTVVSLVGSLNGVSLTGLVNVTFQVEELDAGQPALAYYVGDRAPVVPLPASSINLANAAPPNLVIEIAQGSMTYQMDEQRQLYEELGVAEYWIVDIQQLLVIAFAIAAGSSQGIQQSQILPGLRVELLYEVLQRQRHANHTQIILWLLNDVLPTP